MLSFLLMWLALAAFCVCFAVVPQVRCARGKFNASGPNANAALPLVVLCGIVLVLCMCGCLGALRLGGWLVFSAAAAAVGVTLRMLWPLGRRGALALVKEICLTPAWVLAFGGGMVLALLMAVRQPLPTQWDEFSFWATAAKVVKSNDALYTLVETTNLAARSYPPALAVLCYAFSFFAPAFAPWLLYAAYGMIYFTVFGALVGLLGKKAWAAGVLAALCCVLAPFAVESWYPNQYLVAYVTAYSDLMLCCLQLAAAPCGCCCLGMPAASTSAGMGLPLQVRPW